MSSYTAHKYIKGRYGVGVFLTVLCLYFSYFSMFGERSFSRLTVLNSEISLIDQELAALDADVQKMRERVIAMRPDALDRDLLEERVRYMLGFRGENEWDVL
ncbi:MAG: septum formation initiator family protein [Pseudomonadota bacterium]|nr:septum formation initiator family protein [Pseudomonadota bacterium]